MRPLVEHNGLGERGSVAVLACAFVVVAAMLLVAVVRLGGASTAKGRAEAAADAAALAAADQLALGNAPAACEKASLVAELNDARLVHCDTDAVAAEVVVQLHATGAPSIGAPVQAHARAEVDVSRSSAARGG